MEDLDRNIIYYDQSKDLFNKEFPKINSVKFKDSNVDLVPSIIFINDKPYLESLAIVYFSNEYHIKYLIKYIRLIRMIFNRCNIGKYLHIQILKLAYSLFCIKLMNKYLC